MMPTSANMINTGGPTTGEGGASRGTMRSTAGGLGVPGGDEPDR